MATTTPACEAARKEIKNLRYEELEEDVPTTTFYPCDRLRTYLTEARIREILNCKCPKCRSHLAFFNTSNPIDTLPQITGRDEGPEDPTRTAYSLFALLISVEHPILIIGFRAKEVSDHELERSASQFSLFSRENLKRYTGNYERNNPDDFIAFARDFAEAIPRFAVPHMDSGKFSHYNTNVKLPFIEEKEIGRKLNDRGQLTSEGANGKVFKFKIYDAYRKFPHAKKVRWFARKKIVAEEFAAYLERENLQNAQRYRDDHIVKLIKAYRVGDSINLIFPLARTNLDHLLRDPRYDYGKMRGGPLEACPAWQQLLGIAKALRKIQGLDPESASPLRDSEPEPLCIHFDLKPDNILVEDDLNWVITDFGQAVMTYANSNRTPRIPNRQGTEAYAPPETEHANMETGRRYDIWSLGCIMLEVTAFVVLGYAGLTGSTDPRDHFTGLDQARRATQPWAKNSDHKFYYRECYQGPLVVKKDITDFMAYLSKRVDIGIENSERSKAFFKRIMHLIEQMLQIDVEKRIDVTGVVRTLADAISQASPDISQNNSTELVRYKGESVIGGPELSSIHLWYWSAAKNDWAGANIDAFENDAGSLRLAYWTHSEGLTKSRFQRDHHKIIPTYAFWSQALSGTSKTWLTILSYIGDYPSELDDTRLSFAGNLSLENARIVQSKLTSQHVRASFDLASVFLEKFVPVKDKVKNGARRFFNREKAERVAQELQGKMQLGAATIQLWEEKIDAAAEKRRERLSSASQAGGSLRPPRAEALFESGYREIPPRRAVIYLHQHGFICTIKMDVNWVLEMSEEDGRVLYFVPNKPENDPHFIACWLRPTVEEQAAGYPAGVPLTPGSLQFVEDWDRFEVDKFELTFTTSDGRNLFWDKYMEVKKDWDLKRLELEKTQGYMPVNRRPERFPHPDFAGSGHITKPNSKARFTFDSQVPPIFEHVEENEPQPRVDKGKGKMVEPPDTESNGHPSNGFLKVPTTSPRRPSAPVVRRGTDSLSSGEGRKRTDQYQGGYGRGRGSRPPNKLLPKENG